jgi:hypothetical protein
MTYRIQIFKKGKCDCFPLLRIKTHLAIPGMGLPMQATYKWNQLLNVIAKRIRKRCSETCKEDPEMADHIVHQKFTVSLFQNLPG